MCSVTTRAATRYPKCRQIGEKSHGPRKAAGLSLGTRSARRQLVVISATWLRNVFRNDTCGNQVPEMSPDRGEMPRATQAGRARSGHEVTVSPPFRSPARPEWRCALLCRLPVRRALGVPTYLRGAPMRGGEIMVSLEGAAECLFRVVPDMSGDCNDAHGGVGQHLLRQVHAPLR